MPQTVSEYLRRIEPREVDSKGRYKPVPEPRKRAAADYRSTVALSLAAALRHGAEAKDVWRHIRRYRAQLHNQTEQLELPI